MAIVRTLFFAIIISTLTSAVSAAPDPDWHINFGVSINDSEVIVSSFGTKPNANDLGGPEDCPPMLNLLSVGSNETRNAFAYTVVCGKVLTADYRAPIKDVAKTWDIWLTATEPGTIKLTASSWKIDPNYKLPFLTEPGHPVIIGDYDGGLASLALWHGSDMLWDWKPGQMFAPTQSFNYNGNAIALRLIATPMPTPEPSCIVAILTGLCGLAGLAGKRHAHQ